MFFMLGCATPNHYTGRTLPNGHKAISAGADNLFIGPDDEVKFFMSPSIGYVRGLPFQYEMGLSFYWPYALEGYLRQQITPQSFTLFDASYNLHVGRYFIVADNEINKLSDYYKIGFTVSKNIATYEPFVSYYLVSLTEKELSNEYRINSVFCYGIGFPYEESTIIPEVNLQFRNGRFNKSKAFYSIGIRSPL